MKTTTFTIDPNDLYDYRVKRSARMAVFYAVEEGTLVRPDNCENCQCQHETMQAHHTNYGDPLNVMWLCPNCHSKVHMNKHHPLNPLNHDQTLMPSIQKNITYATVSVTLPIENYLIIKDRAERHGVKVEDQISRTLVRSWPVRQDQRSNDDDAREQHFERISSLVEDEAKLPTQELPRISESRGQGDNFRSAMDRFYSVSARYG